MRILEGEGGANKLMWEEKIQPNIEQGQMVDVEGKWKSLKETVTGFVR